MPNVTTLEVKSYNLGNDPVGIPNELVSTDNSYRPRSTLPNNGIAYDRIISERDLIEISTVEYYLCDSNKGNKPENIALCYLNGYLPESIELVISNKKSISKEEWEKYNKLEYAVKIKTTLKKFKYDHEKKRISINYVDTTFTKGFNKTTSKRNKFFTKKLQAYNLYIKLENGLWYFQSKGFSGKWHKSIKGNLYRDIFPPVFKEAFLQLSPTICKFLNIDYTSEPIEAMFLWACKFHKVRLPNNYKDLMIYHPGLKYLRKYPKYIEAILRRLCIFSGLTNKLVHEGKDPIVVFNYYKILGDLSNKINKERFNVLTSTFKQSPFSNRLIKDTAWKQELKRPMTNHEKLRFVKCINDGVYLKDIIEHFIMLDKFSSDNNLPTIYLKANSNEEFQREHNLLSKKITLLNEEEFEFIFDKSITDVVDKFSSEIEAAHLLKNKFDYIEEGDFQHHCVSYYHNRYHDCFIVSLRFKDGIRITCEVDYKGNIRQARGLNNINYIYDNGIGIVLEKDHQYKEDTVLELQEKFKLALKKYIKNYKGEPILTDAINFPRPEKKITILNKEEKIKQLERYLKND